MKSCLSDTECASSPVHLHVKSRTPVHVHVLKKKHKNQSNDNLGLGIRDDLKNEPLIRSSSTTVDEQYNESCNMSRRPQSRSAARYYCPPRSISQPRSGCHSQVRHDGPWIPPPGKSTTKTYSKSNSNNVCYGECMRAYSQFNCCCDREEMCLTRTREYEQKVCDLVAQVAYLKNKINPESKNDSCGEGTGLSDKDSKSVVDSLLKRLQEVEVEGLGMVPQISSLRDLIYRINDPCCPMTQHEAQTLLNEAQCLRDKLSAYERSSERLRGLLCDGRQAFESLYKSAEGNKKEMEKLAAESQESLEQQLAGEKLKNSTEMNKDKEALKKALRAYKEKCAKFQEEYEKTCRRLRSSESTVAKLNDDLHSKQRQLDQLNQDLKTSQDESAVNTRRVGELETLIERVAQDAANDSLAADAQIKNKHCHVDALTSENCRLKKCVISTEERLRQSEMEVARLKGQLSDFETAIEDYRQQLKDRLYSGLRELESVPEELRDAQLRAKHMTEQFELYKRSHESEVLEVKQELANAKLQQKSELMIYSQESYAANTQLRESINNLNLQVDAMTRENIRLQRQLSESEEDRNRLHRRVINAESNMYRTPAAAVVQDEMSQRRCVQLECELRHCQQELSAVTQQKNEIESRIGSQLSDMRERLDQSHQTNRSLQNYVVFLKSVSQVLNEPLTSTAARSAATYSTGAAPNISCSGTLAGHASAP